MTNPMIRWSAPYYGVSHSDIRNGYRCTVRAHTDLVILAKWRPDCWFAPEEEVYATVAEARTAGETWLLLEVAK